ncbi:MalY/PatB family protein [Pediococcus acidilactici]|uniref:MalY/PatB family protein n=1 Tax=Pediococcus acidilactici TaxID=1254 RepID=UPI0034A07B18
MEYNFDDLADRSIDSARKWDLRIVKNRFPNVRTDFIPQWIADMDFKAAPPIRNALVKMAENGAYGYTYATSRWYDSVVNWQRERHHNEVQKDWITLGYGTVPNMHVLVQALLKPGDSVLVNTPVYGPFAYAAEHNNATVITVPLIKNGTRYDLDWEKIEIEMKNKRPKLTFFRNPHNPSGRIWSKTELIRMAELCKKYKVLFVSDEVHSEHVIKGNFVSALQLPEKYLDNLVMFTSPNKAFNLGGLKLSYSIIPSDAIRKTFRQQYTRNAVTSPNVPGQIAMITAYEKCGDWLDQCVSYIKENLTILTSIVDQDFPGWEMMEMESSYLPWISVKKSEIDMETIARLMAEKAGVVVGVGDDYVANAENFLRLNIGTSHAALEEALKRMATVWRTMI